MSDADPSPIVSGELLRGPRRGWGRVLELVTLWAFARPFVELFAWGVLRRERRGELELRATSLELRSEIRFVHALSRKKTLVLPLERLERLTLEETGPSPTFPLGLGALALGTAWGTGLVTWGLRASGGAGLLVLLGLAGVLLGIGIDWLLERGRIRRGPAPARLVVEPTRGAGFILRGVEPRQAEALLRRLEELQAQTPEPPRQAAPSPA